MKSKKPIKEPEINYKNESGNKKGHTLDLSKKLLVENAIRKDFPYLTTKDFLSNRWFF